jgi:nitrate reductase gamma subunit
MGFYIFTYFCLAVFLAAVLLRIYRQMTLPVHVRWEIYPVQHETAEKAAYGGSYMEGLNWWEKKQERSLFNEIRYMAPEILLLRGLWHQNKRLWWMSFPFHLGLYLMLATFVLLLISAVFTLWDFDAFAEGGVFRTIVDGLVVTAGWMGLIAGVLGSLGLLYKRLTDRALRNYTTFSDYFNVFFILIFFLCALLAALFADPSLNAAKAYVLGLLTAGSSTPAFVPGQSIFGTLTIILASLLIAYIPLTHMSHMFMKYFLYHNVKWDDAPNRQGSLIESAVMQNLKFKPTWKAKHIGADGKKSWRDIASSAPRETK